LAEDERRLAAIVFVDLVDYADIRQKDPPLARLLLEKYREIMQPRIVTHGGHEFKPPGEESNRTGLKDWVAGPRTRVKAPISNLAESIIEFRNALEGTLCAVDIQRALHEHNMEVPGQRKVLVRIGIHLGDVIYREGELFGDAVNIASTIGPLAEPGEILLTDRAYDGIRNKTELQIEKLGPNELGSIKLSGAVYKVVPAWKKNDERTLTPEEKGRVAILPFANISAEPSDEYFADGLTEELISTMSKVHELSVISRTSVMQYKNKAKLIPEMARELNAGTILEGSVRRSGNRVRITIQMIDAMRDKHLWAESYDREMQDIFAIQSDIAKRVTEALKIELLSSEKKDIEKRPTESTEAYTLFLKGRFYWNERTRDATDKAVKYFEQAIKLDPTFALAHAALADCYLIYGDYGWGTPREVFPLAKKYSMMAIEIDPMLAEGHSSLGNVYMGYEWRWHEAEEEFKRAVELKASYATAHHWYSILLRFTGRLDESYEQIKRAGELDPLSRIIGLNIGYTLLVLGRSKEAIEQFGRVIEANPDYAYPHTGLAWAYYLESRIDEAIGELRKSVVLSGGDPVHKAELASLLGFAGRLDESNAILEELKELSSTKYVDKVEIALALFGAGRTDEAFSYLEKGYEERSPIILYTTCWPWLKDLRKDPRWASFERRLGLLEN
jgi:TolB-like protein/Tfp pilus assembly protein PilF